MYSFKLTEEIARWAFEVVCDQAKDWYIAFTNPTAGPWKTIQCTDKDGKEGSVYTFKSKEKRPDILLVNDEKKIIIIIEAKDSIKKLLSNDQPKKSVDVVFELSDNLSKLSDNKYWGARAYYTVFTGLLWGSKKPIGENDRCKAFDTYHDLIKNKSSKYVSKDVIFGIETLRNGETLKCRLCGKEYGTESTIIKNIADSLGLDLITSQKKDN